MGRLKSRLDLLRQRRGSFQDALSSSFEAAFLEKRIDELSIQIDEFNKLRNQNKSVPPLRDISEVPDYLIKRRLRSGVSQTELSRRLGFSRNAVRLYERTRYAGASFCRILQIDTVLQELESTHEFELSYLLAADSEVGGKN